MTEELPETTFPKDALKRTVQDFPPPVENIPLGSVGLSLYLYNVSSRISPWGGNTIGRRDKQLRDFWPTEPFMAGAIHSVGIRDANLQWEIEGPKDSVVEALTDMLNGSIAGVNFGWMEFIKLWSQDYHTQDNGAFIEIIRDPVKNTGSKFTKENAPIIGLAHLDAGGCWRTGNPEFPVVYTNDWTGKQHKMPWYNIIPLSEFASPIQTMNGIGHCSVSRILKFAEIIQSIEVYTDEKVSGRFIKEIHFVSGVAKSELDDLEKKHEEHADNQGLARYIKPMIFASLDPEKPVSTASIPIAAIPDNFNFEELMRWYIAEVALNTGQDYQDLAPLPTGNIGTGQQSEILHRKSRGKGAANFMELWQNMMRDYGIIPKPYVFKFMTKDLAEEMERAQITRDIITGLSIARRTDFIDGTRARQILIRRDVFDPEDLEGIPEDYGNEEMSSKNENPLGQVGDNTVDQDADRTEKSLFEKARDLVHRGKN